MTPQTLTYVTYGLALAGALAVHLAMPQGGRERRGAAFLIGAGAALGVVLLLVSRWGGPVGNNILFGLLALLSLGGAARVVTHSRPVYSALYFVMVALASVGLAVMAGAEFLAAALVIVYAGAILVTYVFVIMLAQQSNAESGITPGSPLDYDGQAREPAVAIATGFLLMAAVGGVIVGRSWPEARPVISRAGNTFDLGAVLLSRHAVSVELAGLLLLVAIVGAIALARRPAPVTEAVAGERRRPGEAGRLVKPF